MAKSLRSKVKRRWRTLKRKVVHQEKGSDNLKLMSSRLDAISKGQEYREAEKKNAFLNPEDPEAEFPQHKPQKMIDLRSENIPYSGFEYVGAKRQKNISKVQLNEEVYKQLQEQNVEIEMGSDNENDDDNKVIPSFSFQKEAMEEEAFKPTKIITKRQQNKKKRSKKIVSF